MDLRTSDFPAIVDAEVTASPALSVSSGSQSEQLTVAPQALRLSPSQQRTSASAYKRKPVTDLVMNSMGFQNMTREREQELARAWRARGDQQARAQLIQAHVRLVTSIARGLVNRGIPLDELVAEGNIGLIRAVDRFDPDAGARLSTFAFGNIRHAMTSLFRRNSIKGRLGHATRRDIALLETAAARVVSTFGREPDDAELAQELNWPPARVAKVRRVRDLVTNWTERLTHEMRLSTAGVDASVEGAADRRRSISDQIESILSVLTPLERHVIELTFGLRTSTRLGSSQVAAVTGLPPREVTRIKTFAQLKLTRQHAASRRAS